MKLNLKHGVIAASVLLALTPFALVADEANPATNQGLQNNPQAHPTTDVAIPTNPAETTNAPGNTSSKAIDKQARKADKRAKKKAERKAKKQHHHHSNKTPGAASTTDAPVDTNEPFTDTTSD